MKVYITTSGPFPNGGANSSRIKCYIQGLLEHNIDCEVLTTSHKDKSNPNLGFRYIRIGKDYSNRHILIRMFYFVKNTLMLRMYLRDRVRANDIVLMYNNEIVESSILTALHKKCKLVREVNEIPYYNSKLTSKIMRWGQFHVFFKKFSGFVTISEPLKQIVEKYKSSNAQVLKVPILVDENKFKHIEQHILNVNHPYIFHSGSLTENKDGFVGMLEAVSIVNQKGYNIHLYSTGYSSNKTYLDDIIKTLNIENFVHFLGFLDDERLRQYQLNSSMFIINKHDTLQNRYCFATKLGEYLSAQKPVIMTNIGEANYYLENNISAMVVSDQDTESIADKIIEILNNPGFSSYIGTNGYNVAKNNFSYKAQSERLLDFFTNLV